jgi:hypothetical protein
VVLKSKKRTPEEQAQLQVTGRGSLCCLWLQVIVTAGSALLSAADSTAALVDCAHRGASLHFSQLQGGGCRRLICCSASTARLNMYPELP